MPAVLLAVTLLAVMVFVLLPRKYAAAPILAAAFLTPFGPQILIWGAHFYVMRIIVLAGICRLLVTRLLSGKPLFTGGLSAIDKTFCLWALVGGIAFLLRQRASGAIVTQAGLWFDAFGGYFTFRYLIQDKEDILRLIKVFACVVAVLGVCMSYEYLTRVDLFSYLAGFQIVPWLRQGRVRAQGGFANSITAGVFGATLVPLFFLLWKNAKARLWGGMGLAGASAVAVTSMASTPITGYLAGILALCLWPIRKKMRWVRWGIVFTILGLVLVMKAPVWFIITKINIASGDAWDRANLIQQAVNHFSEWWMIGTNNNANWGYFTWDACNQFAAEGLSGGIATMALFVLILCRGFGAIGRCRKAVEGDIQEWFFWGLGATLFVHVIVFLGIDYFDQTRMLWFIFLAMISVATMSESPAAERAPESAPHRTVSKILRAIPKTDSNF